MVCASWGRPSGLRRNSSTPCRCRCQFALLDMRTADILTLVLFVPRSPDSIGKCDCTRSRPSTPGKYQRKGGRCATNHRVLGQTSSRELHLFVVMTGKSGSEAGGCGWRRKLEGVSSPLGKKTLHRRMHCSSSNRVMLLGRVTIHSTLVEPGCFEMRSALRTLPHFEQEHGPVQKLKARSSRD